MSRGARMDEEMDNKDERAKVAKNNHEGGDDLSGEGRRRRL